MPRRSGRKIDFVHWTRMAASFLAQSAGTIAVNVSAAQHDPETLLRIRGNLLSFVDTTQAPGGLANVGIGMIMVPEGTGATVLWSPITDADAPWFWIETFSLGYEEMVTDVIDVPGATSFRSTIDSKAMRINRNSEVQAVLEVSNVSGAVAINAVLQARGLSGT